MKLISRIFTVPFWSTALGNLFEHYDMALFGLLSPFLAPIFFPKQDPITALILTYGLIPLGMITRPFGSLFFGFIGDCYGRNRALFLSLFGMGVISLAIAATPGYESIGIFAPLLFCFWRLLQNFLAAGESMGGAIFLLEQVEESEKDLTSSLFGASTIAGILLASFGVSTLCYFGSINCSWRLLYIIGASTALFGLIIRSRIRVDAKSCSLTENSFQLIWKNRKSLFQIILVSGLFYGNASIALVLLNGFVPLVSHLTKAQMSGVNSFLLVIDFLLLPLFGWVAAKISREKLMLMVTLAITFSAIPLFGMLKNANLYEVTLIRIIFILYGVAFSSPFHAWVQEIAPEKGRYTIISLGYAIGSQLFGGTTTTISLWVYKSTLNIHLTGLYWVILALTSSIVLLNMSDKKRLAYE